MRRVRVMASGRRRDATTPPPAQATTSSRTTGAPCATRSTRPSPANGPRRTRWPRTRRRTATPRRPTSSSDLPANFHYRALPLGCKTPAAIRDKILGDPATDASDVVVVGAARAQVGMAVNGDDLRRAARARRDGLLRLRRRRLPDGPKSREELLLDLHARRGDRGAARGRRDVPPFWEGRGAPRAEVVWERPAGLRY